MPFLRGLFLEGLIFGGASLVSLFSRFKIDRASLIVGRKFTVFALTTVNSENKPRDLYFSKALFEGLIFGGASLRREFAFTNRLD